MSNQAQTPTVTTLIMKMTVKLLNQPSMRLAITGKMKVTVKSLNQFPMRSMLAEKTKKLFMHENVTTKGLTGKLSRGRKDERTKGRSGLARRPCRPVVPVVLLGYIMSLPRTQIDSLSSC